MLLVTGVTGHSGSYFLKELIKNNYNKPIRCVVRETSDTSLIDNSGLNIEKVVGDLDNQKFMDEVMDGVDTIMHIGAIFYSTTVIKAALKHDVKKAILIHTTGIFSKYKSASEEYKSIESRIEELVIKSGASISITILRPTMIYGDLCDLNMSKFIKMVDKLRVFPVINHGKGLIQPVNARDLGMAFYQVLIAKNNKNGDYILSGEKPITMLEAFKLISQNLEKKTTFISFPMGIGVFLARCLKICTLGKVDYVEKVQRMGEDRSFSHKEATRDFGYNPRSFEEGIKVEVEQYLRKIGNVNEEN